MIITTHISVRPYSVKSILILNNDKFWICRAVNRRFESFFYCYNWKLSLKRLTYNFRMFYIDRHYFTVITPPRTAWATICTEDINIVIAFWLRHNIWNEHSQARQKWQLTTLSRMYSNFKVSTFVSLHDFC